jgi:hypothetical protein
MKNTRKLLAISVAMRIRRYNAGAGMYNVGAGRIAQWSTSRASLEKPLDATIG